MRWITTQVQLYHFVTADTYGPRLSRCRCDLYHSLALPNLAMLIKRAADTVTRPHGPQTFGRSRGRCHATNSGPSFGSEINTTSANAPLGMTTGAQTRCATPRLGTSSLVAERNVRTVIEMSHRQVVDLERAKSCCISHLSMTAAHAAKKRARAFATMVLMVQYMFMRVAAGGASGSNAFSQPRGHDAQGSTAPLVVCKHHWQSLPLRNSGTAAIRSQRKRAEAFLVTSGHRRHPASGLIGAALFLVNSGPSFSELCCTPKTGGTHIAPRVYSQHSGFL